jgi:hypothetical protein
MMEAIHSSHIQFLREPHGVTSQETAFLTETLIQINILKRKYLLLLSSLLLLLLLLLHRSLNFCMKLQLLENNFNWIHLLQNINVFEFRDRNLIC